MSHNVRKVAVAMLVGGAVVAAGAGTAFASGATGSTTSGGGSPAAVKAKAATAIQDRITSLDAAVSKVNADTAISSSDRTTLLGILNGDLSGLTALGTKIQADQTFSEAAADYKTVFTGYRIYALALPQARLVAGSDKISTTVVPHLDHTQSKLQARLSGADTSKDTQAVQSAMADLAGRIQAATSEASGLPTTILSITPADYDANHAVLTGPRSDLATARSDVNAARQDVKTVRAAIR